MVCGGAPRTSLHNKVFLSGLKLRTLEAAPEELGGRPSSSAEPLAASIRAFAHIYLALGPEPGLLREQLFETALGQPDLTTFLEHDWEDSFGAYRAANLYAQALTWQEADISADDLYSGDLGPAPWARSVRYCSAPARDRPLLQGRRQRG